MSNLPLVSIVTPSYNQAQFLEETILSVITQDYPNIEYIVMDGGSTDESVEILKKYTDRISYWVSEPDRGQSDAINKGWSICKGDILAFLNSDDYYLPGAITKIVTAFQDNPQVGFICGQGEWVDYEGKHLADLPFWLTEDVKTGESWEIFALDSSTSIPQPAAFVHRKVIDKIGMIDDSLHYALDGDFFLRTLANFKATVLSDKIACLRVHDNSKSFATGTNFIPDLMKVTMKAIENPQLYPRCKIIPNDAISATYILSARFSYSNYQYLKSFKYLSQAVALSTRHWNSIIKFDIPRILIRLILINKNIYSNLSKLVFSRK